MRPSPKLAVLAEVERGDLAAVVARRLLDLVDLQYKVIELTFSTTIQPPYSSTKG